MVTRSRALFTRLRRVFVDVIIVDAVDGKEKIWLHHTVRISQNTLIGIFPISEQD